MTQKTTKVFVVDDHQLIIDSIVEALQKTKDLQPIGHANNGHELLKKIPTIRPNLIVMDLNMPDMNGFEATELVKELYPEIKVLILTMQNSRSFIVRAINYGADGYISKGKDKKELIDAIRKVAKGDFTMMLDGGTESNPLRETRPYMDVLKLTERERQIMGLYCKELSQLEIASYMRLLPGTIDMYSKNIMQKVKVRDKKEMIQFALHHGIGGDMKLQL